MRTNLAVKPTIFTHEGAPAKRIDAEAQLRRSVMSCLLWEREFYEDGEDIATRIAKAAREVSPPVLANVAIDARRQQNLRHAPLLLLSVLAEIGKGQRDLVVDTIEAVISRADELTEFLSVHLKRNGVERAKLASVLTNPMKIGIARAFAKFDEYQLAKYDRATAVRLRDVVFLCHVRPTDLTRRLVANELKAPNTWEVALSGGADKRETFERLLRDGKLGYMALLRNLRNMDAVGVDAALVEDAIKARKGAHRVLPFRFVAAARAAPRFEPALDQALCAALDEMPRLPGTTAVLVDVSGSMESRLSNRSDMERIDAACALASMINGERLRVFSFSNDVVEVPPRRGMAGVDAIRRSQANWGTALGAAVGAVNTQVQHDRLIVISDEQSSDRVPDPVAKRAYMINIASAKNGVGYGRWTHIDGWSESVLRFIHEHEASAQA